MPGFHVHVYRVIDVAEFNITEINGRHAGIRALELAENTENWKKVAKDNDYDFLSVTFEEIEHPKALSSDVVVPEGH